MMREAVAGQLSGHVSDAHEIRGEELDGARETKLGALWQAHDLPIPADVEIV